MNPGATASPRASMVLAATSLLSCATSATLPPRIRRSQATAKSYWSARELIYRNGGVSRSMPRAARPGHEAPGEPAHQPVEADARRDGDDHRHECCVVLEDARVVEDVEPQAR